MNPLDLTPEQILPAFPGAKLGVIQRYWPFVREALREDRLESAQIVAYTLGTLAAENAGFAPLTEMPSQYNTDREPFDVYEGRANLGNTQPGDGARFRGRGFVQLTGRANYKTYGERLGLDLETEPNLAGDPRIAAQLLALFIADRENPILSALKTSNFALARRLVNGGRHGLDRFENAYNVIFGVLSGG